jgi:DNA helicase-4
VCSSDLSTTHGYKGLEKRVVIVLDAVARSYPLIHPDWVFSRILGDSPEKITKEEQRLLYVALTRAVQTLVIFTDGRSKSPFLEELERKHALSAIEWNEFPPVSDSTTRLIIKVGNQERRGGGSTMAIKDHLKATGYQWQRRGWPAWVKCFPVEGFNLDILKGEVWAESADGLEVRVLDDTETLAARYLVDKGHWHCLVDKLDALCAPKA